MSSVETIVKLSTSPSLSSDFGGKAATLAALLAHGGIQIPDGVAVSAEWSTSHLSSVQLPDAKDYSDFQGFAAAVQAQVVAASPDASFEEKLEAAMAELEPPEDGRWIVRSSAVGEDSATKSFAGQLDSIVVENQESIASAVVTVWASAWNRRASHYRQELGLTDLKDLPVAVLIQPYLPASYAGVMFTTSPLPGQMGTLIEAVRGPGENLVGGSTAPARYYIDQGELTSEGEPSIELSSDLVRTLSNLGAQIAQILDAPQDIEWVITADSAVHIVQARPITTLSTTLSPLNSDDFAFEVLEISNANAEAIPDVLSAKDKVRLRLIADRAGVAIGRGWLIKVTPVEAGRPPAPLGTTVTAIRTGVERSDQVSFVLQNPARVDGEIIRQFSRVANLEGTLQSMLDRVGPAAQTFDLIATEIYAARLSGIAHLVGDRLVVEVAFGSYVPKGIVPTSMYVVSGDGTLESNTEVLQEHAVFIEGGAPVERLVGEVARLTTEQLVAIGNITHAVGAEHEGVSVEFGVLADGTPYLIDIIPDTSPIQIDDVRVMSPGSIAGVALVNTSDELAEKSLDAHFYSERSAGSNEPDDEPAVIVVSPRPFLALEEHLVKHGSGRIGFVFEQGSLLGHLAIVLREHKVPAIVVPNALARIAAGDTVAIDTSSEDLLQIVELSETSA